MNLSDKWYFSVYSIVIFFVAGAALATSALLLLLIPQSSDFIRLAEWRMLRAESMKMDVNVQYHGTQDQTGHLGVVERHRRDMNFDFDGVMRRDKEEVNGDYDFLFSFGAENPVLVGGDYIHADQKDYLRLTEIPDNVGGVNVGFFRDKTLRVNFDDILPATNLPFVGGTDRLDQYDRAYLLNEARSTPFVRVEEKMKDEMMHGVKVHHYKVMPEKLYAREFVVLAEQLRRDRELTNRERIAWDTFFTHVTPMTGEIWIGTGDYYIHRIRLQFRYSDTDQDGVLTLTAEFSEFNEPHQVLAPSSGQADEAAGYLESVISGLTAHLPMAKEGSGRKADYSVSSLGSLVDAQDSKGADDDEDGLPAFLEVFYGSDSLNPDTDGDGVHDGQEVDTGWSPTGPWRLFDFSMGMFD